MKRWFGAPKADGAFQESFAWIHILKNMYRCDFCVFDPQGNIVASTLKEKKRHVLELFSKTDEAQALLQRIESPGATGNPGFWIDGHGQKKFLYRVA
ncbi:MAG: hypothetical protein HY609_05445 [Deltaproteobacteria bacterium]|nr:hypothetical protein [Deltaproteobacteria bacterium]MBI4224358.1 hypothetical protein [Deltaproteobacteria bacterium]